MQQMMLGIEPIASSHAHVIKQLMREIFDRWEIREGMVFRLKSDAHSSNISAYKDDYCGKDSINLTANNCLCYFIVLQLIENATTDDIHSVYAVEDLEANGNLDERVFRWMDESDLPAISTHQSFDQQSGFNEDDIESS